MSWITCPNQNLLDFIYQAEGHYNFLYADTHRDSEHYSDPIPTISAGVALTNSHQAVLFHTHYPFRHHQNGTVTAQVATPFEVSQEWHRVKTAGRIPHFFSSTGQQQALRIAQLRLTDEDARRGICFRINPWLERFRQVAAWGDRLPEEIQIAILDARVQPVGHNPFNLGSERTLEMWNNLKRTLLETTTEQRRQVGERALELFTQIWASNSSLDKTNPRYRERQSRRVDYFRRGVQILVDRSP